MAWFYNSEEFQAFFRHSRRSTVIKANLPNFTIIAVSDTYLNLTQRKREDLLGSNFFDIFPGNAVAAAQQTSLMQSFERVIQNKTSDELPVYEYQIFLPEQGTYITHYWSNLNEPVFDEEGNVAYIIRTVTNLTDKVLAEYVAEEKDNLKDSLHREQALNEELAATNEELRAVNEELSISQEQLFGLTHELEKRVESRTREIKTSENRFRSLVEQMPAAINVFIGQDLIVDLPNKRMLELWGRSFDEVNGKPLDVGMPELKGQPFVQKLRDVIATGISYSSTEEKAFIKRNGRIEELFFDIVYQPVINSDGTITSCVQIASEVTEAVLAKKKIQLLNEELAASNEELAASNEELRALNEEVLRVQDDLQNTNSLLTISEERFRAITDSPDIYIGVVNELGIPVYANEAFLRLTGRTLEEFTRKGYADLIHPDDRDNFLYGFMQAFAKKEEYIGEYRMRDTAGNYGVFTSNVVPLFTSNGLFSGYLSTSLNITDERNSQQKLKNLNEELKTTNDEMAAANEELSAANEELLQAQNSYANAYNQVLETGEDLAFTIHAASLATFDLNPSTGRFKGNDLLKAWFGLAPEEEIELQKATDVIAEEDRGRVVNAINKALQFSSGGDYNIDYTINNPNDNTPRMVRAKGKTIFDSDRQPLRLSGILQDITEQKRDEQRKNDFIGMVSHEMKTPLTSLNGFLQLLQMRTGSGDDFAVSMINKANKQINKMTTLINGFLNVSRLESGKIHIDKSRFDMAVLVKEVEEEIKTLYSSHNIVFHPVEETFVNADKDKIGQVINNLISNAVKYSPTGTEIHVSCITHDITAVVSVKDEGMGIRTEDQPKLFDRYYRVNNDNTTTPSGFGIGLYLCAEIIQRHDGKIWVESEPGKGSMFSFSLPVIQ